MDWPPSRVHDPANTTLLTSKNLTSPDPNQPQNPGAPSFAFLRRVGRKTSTHTQTNHNRSGAPSFALLRRVGRKTSTPHLNQPQTFGRDPSTLNKPHHFPSIKNPK